MKKEKSIPTIIGLIIFILSIFAGVYLTNNPVKFGSKASGDCQPVNLRISNVTHQSFTFSFTTTIECLSTLSLDSRTINDQNSKSLIHYFQVDSLNPDSEYQFSVISGGDNYTGPDYRVKTAQIPKSSLPTSNLAWGKVFSADNTPAIGSLVYLNFDQNLPLSARVTTGGYWSISLASSFNATKDDWAVPQSDMPEEIIVFGADGTVTILEGNTSANNPVPDIILGQNNFSPSPTNGESGDFPPVSDSSRIDKSLSISNPQEGESITVLKPEFFGTAPQGSDLTIKVESPVVYSDQISPNSDGSWNWSPPKNLSPGEHTVTVTARDPQTGVLETISRKFIVYASDSDSPSFIATGSATTVTPTPVPSQVPTSTPTVFFTPSPTATLVPTDSPTSAPKPTVRSARPTNASGELAKSGSPEPTVLLLIAGGLILIISRFLLKVRPN